jgi:ABC-type glycerol-3-phosphate transport system substrate-binding protein
LLDKYGESFFARLRPNIRPATGGVAGMQGLAAGEGSFIVPAIISTIENVKEKGAPLGVVGFDYTTGVDMQMMLSARGRAKHPAAARLFANYIMSPEGNKVMNDEPGGFAIYESSKLPKDYQQEKPGTAARRPAIVKILGF